METTKSLVTILKENPDCTIFTILDSDDENPIEWKIKPTSLQIIPNGEGNYLVKGFIIDKTGAYKHAYVNVSTPERIVDFVLFDIKNPQYAYAYGSRDLEVIPAVASDCFGSYEVYYSRNNPDLAIDVLKKGLKISKEKYIIAEDLGYILSDEGRKDEALEYFLISEKHVPSSEFILAEIEKIYRLQGNHKKGDEYKLKIEKIEGKK